MSAYPSWCCQYCGEHIGWLGRGIDLLTRPFGFTLHGCGYKRPITLAAIAGRLRMWWPLSLRREVRRLRSENGFLRNSLEQCRAEKRLYERSFWRKGDDRGNQVRHEAGDEQSAS